MDDKVLYEQGSKMCQQYSDLTMRIRTQAIFVMFSYLVGITIALSKIDEVTSYLPLIAVFSAAISLIFAVVLGLLNYHYSTAHDRIRTVLVELEKKVDSGPWHAHQDARMMKSNKGLLKYSLATRLAWYSPFFAVGLVGIGGAIVLWLVWVFS